MMPGVIPAFDAERTIGAVVTGARVTGLDPLFVVDDGSRDATAGLAERAGAIVLRHPLNRGKGAALWTGFAAAQRRSASAVLTLDADGQHDPADIPRLLAAHRANPRALVVGVRELGSETMPLRSRLGNRVSTFFIGRFIGRPLADSQCGFRIYPTSLLARIEPRARRFDSETELLLAAVTHDHPIVEVPVQTIYQGAGSTHFHDVADVLRIIKLVVGWAAATAR